MRGRVAALGGLAFCVCAGAAQADSGPFYGYSPYFGGPTTYYTPEPDVRQATTYRDGEPGFGVRTYTRGGPFWGYQPARSYSVYHGGAARPYRVRRRVLRVRG